MLKRLKCFFGFHSWITEYKKRCCYFGFPGWLKDELCIECGKTFSVFQTDEINIIESVKPGDWSNKETWKVK